MNYPIVKVTKSSSGKIQLEQNRFLTDPDAVDPGKYPSPYKYAYVVNPGKYPLPSKYAPNNVLSITVILFQRISNEISALRRNKISYKTLLTTIDIYVTQY